MKRTWTILAFLVLLLGSAGCSGLNQQGRLFNAHGECFNLFGFQIPQDSMILAEKQVPRGAEVQTVVAAPDDTGSLLGVLNRICGMGYTSIGGTVGKKDSQEKAEK